MSCGILFNNMSDNNYQFCREDPDAAAFKLSELERENARLRAALYVIGYNTEPPCLDHAADIAQTTLTQSADYSSFRPLPNA